MSRPSLSPYLRKLVEKGMLEADAAESIGRLSAEQTQHRAAEGYISSKKVLLEDLVRIHLGREEVFTRLGEKFTPEGEAADRALIQNGPIQGYHPGYLPSPAEVQEGCFFEHPASLYPLQFPAGLYASDRPLSSYLRELLRHRVIVGWLAEALQELPSEEDQYRALKIQEKLNLDDPEDIMEEVRYELSKQ